MMSWQPLLEDAASESARESVRAILVDLESPGREPSGDPSLAGGTAGLAVLHGYLAQTGLGPEPEVVARRCLRHAIAAVSERPGTASLYSGLAGVGWATTHLNAQWPEIDGEDELAEIDEVLLDHLNQSPWRGVYDLIDGLVGFGIYAMERLPRPTARVCLERVVDRLADTTEIHDEGTTWWTDPSWLAEETRAESPCGYYNLGLAHGVPGVIAFLGQACAAGVSQQRARSLLDGAVSWLMSQDSADGFGYWIGPDRKRETARLAWCYGDPGVAAGLMVAARSVGEPAWESAALEIAHRATGRPFEQAGVKDAGLCHGAAGLAHLFNRMYQATGKPWLAEFARSWFKQTLVMRRAGQGIGGYEAWRLPRAGPDWSADPGLLTGAAGIALALLAATTPIEPLWDRMLLVSIPPRADS
jgi:hypothetical protein